MNLLKKQQKGNWKKKRIWKIFTLAINLAKYYNTNFVEEVGRELSELSVTDKMMLSEDYVRILLEHKNKELRIKENSN